MSNVLGFPIGYDTGSSWSARRSKPVKNEGEVVDLGAKFGIAVGSDSDSSDAEFAPENVEVDSGDSGEDSSGGEGGDEGEEEGEGEKEGEREQVKPEVAKEEEEETMAVGGGEMVVMREGSREEDPPPSEMESGTGAPGPEPGKKNSGMGSDQATGITGERTGANGDDGGDGGGGEGVKEEYNPLIVRRSNRAIKPTKDVELYLLGAKFGIDVEDESGGESSDIEFAPAENSPGTYLLYI